MFNLTYLLTYVLYLNFISVYSSSSDLSVRNFSPTDTLIYGLDVVGCGYDIRQLRSRYCLLDWSRNSNTSSWADPQNQSLSYVVPDGFYVTNTPDSLEVLETQFIKTAFEFIEKTFYHMREDSSGFLGFASSSRTADVESVYKQFYQFDNYLASTIRQILWYSLSVITFPRPKLNIVTAKALASLPTVFNEANKTHLQLFEQFFGSFGTHIVASASLGGLIWAQDWFNSCLMRTRNTTWIREQIKKRSAWGLFQSSEEISETFTAVSEEWIKHTEYSLRLIGGTESIDVSKWREWIPTVKYDPRPISLDLIPIYTLLSEKDIMREALQQATLYFRTKADTDARIYIDQLQTIPKLPKSRCEEPERLLRPRCRRQMSSSNTSLFTLTDEARSTLCPFVDFEGLRCFGDTPSTFARQLTTGPKKLPRGVGTTVDQSTGRLMAPAIELTYVADSSQTWTDGHSGQMYDLFNEAKLGPPATDAAAYDALGVRLFHSAPEINSAWEKTFARSTMRGGEFARSPDVLEYYNKYFSLDQSLALSQRVIGLYTLSVNASTLKLNHIAQRAISSLTSIFNAELYEDFLNAWGTHIITKTLIGGMLEELATVKRCLTILGDTLVSQCIPFSDRTITAPECVFYTNRTRVTSKRRLGGNVELQTDNEWKRTLASAPVLLQILEMVPWYEFVTDTAVKENLRAAIRYRLEVANVRRAETLRNVNARYTPWSPLLNPSFGVSSSICSLVETVPIPSSCIISRPHCYSKQNEGFTIKYEWDNSKNSLRAALYKLKQETTYSPGGPDCYCGYCTEEIPHTITTDVATGIVGNFVQQGCSLVMLPDCANLPVGVCIKCESSDSASCRVGEYQCASYNE